MEDSIEDQILSLRSELKTYGAEIVNHISTIYSSKSSTIDLKNDPRNMLKIIKHDITQLLQEAQAESEYNEENMEAIRECGQLASTLDTIAIASTAIAQCSETITGTDILAACAAIFEVERLMTSIPAENTTYGSGAVCDMLRRESNMLRTRFVSRLGRLLQDCIRITRGHISVSKELAGVLRSEDSLLASAVRLADIWSAITAVGGNKVESIIGGIISSLWKDIMSPLWKERKIQAPRLIVNGKHAEFSVELPNVDTPNVDESADGSQLTSQAPPCRMKFSQLLDLIGQIAGFLYAEVFCSNDKVLAIARKILCDGLTSSVTTRSPSLLNALRETMVSLIPKHEAEVENFQSVVRQSCFDFEKKMELFGLLELPDSDPDAGGLLMQAVKEIPTKFLAARRLEVLSRARSLVLGDYHNTMLGTGNALEDDPASAGSIGDSRAMLEQSGLSFSLHAIPFEACQVSLASCRLLKLVHEVLKQACSSVSPQLVAILYQSARDCFEIFAAVAQSKFADVINTVPRMGAVFYNDCCYIAHNATLISHHYRQDICTANADLQDCVGFVDFIPRFRSMGERVLQEHVEEQKKTLLVLLSRVRIHIDDEGERDEGDEFGDSSEGPAYGDSDSCNSEEAATILVKHMGRLKGQWQNVLQESVYERLAGFLLEVVLRRAMRPVLQAKFVSEKAATDASRVFKTIQKSRSVFLDMVDDNRLSSLVGSWSKFCALTDLLEFSLSDITEWLPRRKFAEFTGGEMTSLIKALFEDSSRRQTVLASILEMSS